MSKLRTLFSIDFRSLAALRMGLATLILADLLIRSQNLVAHYTDFGVLPRHALIEHFLSPWQISIYLIGGTWAFQLLLFFIAGAAAVGLLLGYRTKFCTLISWFFLISLNTRNPMVLQGGDVLFRLLLFWTIFLPTGRVWSIDNLRSQSPPAKGCYFSVGTVALLLQIVYVYFFSCLLKSGPEWHSEGTAIYLALSLDQFRLPIGDVLLSLPMTFLQFLTRATFWFELIGPLLLFFPFKTQTTRVLLILLFCSFHLLIGISIRLGLFPFISCISFIAFIPSLVWDLWYQNAGNTIGRMREIVNSTLARLSIPPIHVHRTAPHWIFSQLLPLMFLIYITVWNIYGMNDTWDFPNRLRIIANIFRIDQHWNLFAPHPMKDDGWFVIPAQLADSEDTGQVLDLIRGGRELSSAKPKRVTALYPTYRWRKYMRNLWLKQNEKHRLYYGKYLCRSWNSRHRGQKLLQNFEIIFMKQQMQNNLTKSKPMPIRLWQHHCFE